MSARRPNLFTGNVVRGCEQLYRHGDGVDPTDPFCYRVTKGFVLLTLKSEKKDLIVALLEKGEYFGEESYLALGQRRYGALVMKESRVTKILPSPEALTALLHDVAERDYFRNQLLALDCVRAKAELVRSRYSHICLTDTVLARMLGASRETVYKRRRRKSV